MPIFSRNTRRRIPAAIVTATLATALVAGTAACAGSASLVSTGGATPAGSASASASADPLAGLNGQQIFTRAITDTKAATSVRLTGKVTDSGQTITLDLTVVRGKGCQGTLAVSKTGSFKLVYNGTTVWMLPNDAFYRSQGATAPVLAILDGKYLKVSASESGLGSMANLCSLSALLNGFSSPPAGYPRGATVTVDGQRAIKISDSGDAAFIDVSDAAKPELIRLYDPSSGQVDFRYAGTAVAITPPSASMVIDGSKYGF